MNKAYFVLLLGLIGACFFAILWQRNELQRFKKFFEAVIEAQDHDAL